MYKLFSMMYLSESKTKWVCKYFLSKIRKCTFLLPNWWLELNNKICKNIFLKIVLHLRPCKLCLWFGLMKANPDCSGNVFKLQILPQIFCRIICKAYLKSVSQTELDNLWPDDHTPSDRSPLPQPSSWHVLCTDMLETHQDLQTSTHYQLMPWELPTLIIITTSSLSFYSTLFFTKL